jgi:hypothetical protein
METVFWFVFWLALCVLCGVAGGRLSGKNWVGVVVFVVAMLVSPKLVMVSVAVMWLCIKFGKTKKEAS